MYRLSVLFSNVFFPQFVIRKLCYALRAEIFEEIKCGNIVCPYKCLTRHPFLHKDFLNDF